MLVCVEIEIRGEA